jgi:translation elongation factor EF-G
MAFKLVEEPFGQVTYMRIYQGTLRKGQFYYNSRQRKKAGSAGSCEFTPMTRKTSIRRARAISLP